MALRNMPVRAKTCLDLVAQILPSHQDRTFYSREAYTAAYTKYYIKLVCLYYLEVFFQWQSIISVTFTGDLEKFTFKIDQPSSTSLTPKKNIRDTS